MTAEDSETTAAQREIDALAKAFFELFTNRHGVTPRVSDIHDLFVPDGVIVKCSESGTEKMSLNEFIEPRRKILTDGTLLDFEVREESAQTFVFGRMASRVSIYRKSGHLRGASFEARGVKYFHFVQTSGGWRLSSVIWQDEHPGWKVWARIFLKRTPGNRGPGGRRGEDSLQRAGCAQLSSQEIERRLRRKMFERLAIAGKKLAALDLDRSVRSSEGDKHGPDGRVSRGSIGAGHAGGRDGEVRAKSLLHPGGHRTRDGFAHGRMRVDERRIHAERTGLGGVCVCHRPCDKDLRCARHVGDPVCN